MTNEEIEAERLTAFAVGIVPELPSDLVFRVILNSTQDTKGETISHPRDYQMLGALISQYYGKSETEA